MIHADADAAATDTQPLTSLTYQPDIPQDITSHHITSHAIVTLNYSHSTSTVQCNTIPYSVVQSLAALLSIVQYYHRIHDASRPVVLRVISVELIWNTHRHYYYYFHFYYCHYHRVVIIADRYSHSV